ncbi:MAG: hypothetical protein PHX18_02800 [Candidatus Gastranaerophilales bacterium]|nr:hypothetical protein [Candidatus Gastranaerophilales bacterium]
MTKQKQDLNKLQIRSMLLSILEDYKEAEDFRVKKHQNNVEALDVVEDRLSVIELLLKELLVSDGIRLDAITILLSDFATLEEVESVLWEMLQNRNIEDNKKSSILSLLRTLGGKIDSNILFNCFNNPDEMVDKETKDFLNVATVNPEAQIDFLDFLSALSEPEQIQLLKSLKDDYEGDELAGILAPTLQSNPIFKVKELIVEILGDTKSYLSVAPLKYLLKSVNEDELKKKALKSLNLLKDAGIEIDNNEKVYLREKEICETTVPYKAFLSQIDGAGNQGIIFSRINKKDFIEVFSTVINISDGIIDCFGFSAITKEEFIKVLERFRSSDIVVPVAPEVAKAKLSKAQAINQVKDYSTPYEYICWKAYLYDVEDEEINFNEIMTQPMEILTPVDLEVLYDTECFDSWFFEYNDTSLTDEIIEFAIKNFTAPGENYIQLLEDKFSELYSEIFTPDKIKIYSQMLKESAYVFYRNDQFVNANLALNLANIIKKGENKFLKDILRRSILQYTADIIAQEEKPPTNRFIALSKEAKPALTQEKAFELLEFLETQWGGKYFE